MNILLLGAPILTAGFRELGHSVLTCTTDGSGNITILEFPTSIQTVFRKLPYGWHPDCILLTDDSTYPMFWGLEEVNVPLVWYAIDSHIHHAWHRGYAATFDFIFVAQRDSVPLYEFDCDRQLVKWLPVFTPPMPQPQPVCSPTFDLSFVGNVDSRCNPERRKFIEAIQARYPLLVSTGEFVSIFTRSKMVLNQCASNDLNFRTFEAMTCGSLLLMENIENGLDELFQDGVHLVLYEKGNVGQVVELAQYYSRHHHEREAIARAGQNEVRANHTSVHRVKSIVEDLIKEGTEQRIRQRMAMVEEIQYVLKQIYAYVSVVYDSFLTSVSSESYRFQELSSLRDKFKLHQTTLKRA